MVAGVVVAGGSGVGGAVKYERIEMLEGHQNEHMICTQTNWTWRRSYARVAFICTGRLGAKIYQNCIFTGKA